MEPVKAPLADRQDWKSVGENKAFTLIFLPRPAVKILEIE
jgi:hypothetical protein